MKRAVEVASFLVLYHLGLRQVVARSSFVRWLAIAKTLFSYLLTAAVVKTKGNLYKVSDLDLQEKCLSCSGVL